MDTRLAESARGRGSLALRRQICTLVARTTSKRGANRHGVISGEVERLIRTSSQTELRQRMVQPVHRRHPELHLLPLRNLEVLEQSQIAIEVGWSSQVRPLLGPLSSVGGRSEAVRIEVRSG